MTNRSEAAVTLIAITAVIGYIFSFVGAIIWNRLHRKSPTVRGRRSLRGN